MDNTFMLLFGMFLVTFGVRYASLALVGRFQLPDPALRALRYVPVAVLTAITVPAALMPTGTLDLHYTNAYMVAGVVAVGVSWRTKNLLATIVIGMIFFFAWRLLLG